MKSNKPSKDNTLCLLPFYHISTTPFGKYRLCCEAAAEPLSQLDKNYTEWWASTELKEIREKISQGKKHPSCQNCYRIEEVGGVSRRLRPDLLVDQNNIDFENPKLKSIDLRVGNLCNAMCISCQPEYSSLIEKEYRVLFKDHSSFKNIIDVPEEKMFDIPDSYIQTLESLYISGGEPSLSPRMLKFIKKLNSNCHLAFNTNIHFINKEFWEELKRFKFLTIGPSCDGVDESFDFLRYPIKFKNFKRNSLWLIENFPNAFIYFNFTYSILNFDQVQKVFFFAQEMKSRHQYVTLVYNILTIPPQLCVNTLPKSKRLTLSSEMEKFINSNLAGLRDLQSLDTLNNLNKFLENDDLPERTFKRLQSRSKDFIEKLSAHRNIAIPSPLDSYIKSLSVNLP